MISRMSARVLPPANIARVFPRRALHASRVQHSSPYHYPEGPLSNIPFNPRKRGFAIKYWTFMAVGFGAPFLIAIWQTYRPA